MLHTQVKQYIQHLTEAHIIHSANRFDIVGKRHVDAGEKYYFEDLGIRNVLVGFKPTDIHKLMENALYNHLRYLGYTVKVGVLNQLEIDFVAEKDQELVYIQVTLSVNSEQTQEREYGNLLKIADN